MSLVVLNGNKEEFVGRFNGKDYYFPFGQQVPIDAVAAAHILGFGNDDKKQVAAYHGLHNRFGSMEKAIEYLAKIKVYDPSTEVQDEAPTKVHSRLSKIDRADAIVKQ